MAGQRAYGALLATLLATLLGLPGVAMAGSDDGQVSSGGSGGSLWGRHDG